MEPSGKGWPLPGTPALYALIMAGLATITLSMSSCRAEETSAQSSYPLKSENAIPPGDTSEYLSLSLSWPSAKRAATQRTASTATAVATMAKPPKRFTAGLFLSSVLAVLAAQTPSHVHRYTLAGRHWSNPTSAVTLRVCHTRQRCANRKARCRWAWDRP